jgi:DNA-binding SARP family transcriptional activator
MPRGDEMREEPGPEYHLELLGAWLLRSGDREIPVQRGGQKLLVLLALRGRMPRLQAAAALHPEVPDHMALTRLRTAVARIKRQAPGLLLVVDGSLQLGARVEVDLHQVMSTARGLTRAHLTIDGPEDVDVFCLIDCGELLPGWYDDWLLFERERLSQLRVQALETVAEQCLARGNHSVGLEAATAAVTIDPLRETAQRALARVLLAQGNRASAEHQIDQYRGLVLRELGVELPREMFCGVLESSEPG